ncbi:Cullin family protein [Diaporthe sp. PMI_573]|nr:Cullin family protein [Diaporthaceae sp. PMI_573]
MQSRPSGTEGPFDKSPAGNNYRHTSPPSRRRPRVDSIPSSSHPRTAPDPKRIRSGETLPTPAFRPTPAASVKNMATSMMSAKAMGKKPEGAQGFQPLSGAKKIVIKNLRTSSRTAADVEDYYKKTWDNIETALRSILRGEMPRVPLERVYRGVEDLCLRGQGDKLSSLVRQQCEKHLSREVLSRIREGGLVVSTDVLLRVRTQWAVFDKTLITVRSTFSYLDRSFLLNNRKYQSINDLLLSLFRKMIFNSATGPDDPDCGKKVVMGMCQLVEHDRRGNSAGDPTLLHDSVSMLKVLGVYGSKFEREFLRQSEEYFTDFAADHSNDGLRSYITACERLLKKEDYRCNRYNFDSTTKVLLLEKAHEILIQNYSEVLLNQGDVSRLLDDNEISSVKALYSLLCLSNIPRKLKGPWEEYIHQAGAGIVNDTEKGDEMVIRLLEFRRFMDIMIRDAFGGDEIFTYSLREAFTVFINDKKITSSWGTGTSKVGEMIAKHMDMLLRGGIKALPKSLISDSKDRIEAERSGQASTGDEDAELDRQLDAALELFRFIEGKDVFEAFYKKDLARRLLMGRSASQDAERSMLTKLKSECGSSFTHNLEQMFKDMALAKEEMVTYRGWVDATGRDRKGVDLSVSVLSQAAWPSYPDVKMLIPEDVAAKIDQYDAFYKNKHTGRKLFWKHNLAHCMVKGYFAKGTKDLAVSAMQASVLVLFNQAKDGVLSYEQISTSTGLIGGELERTLQSLACGKVRVLSKHPKGRDVTATDTFSFNQAFTHPMVRIKINQIQLRETAEENQETHRRVAADRQFETQAAIVRVMKSRKTVPHAQLVAEVINQTKRRGAMDPGDIKQNIEKLIEKDYLEREGNSYTYLA